MARERKFDPETARLWQRLTERHSEYPDSRKSSIVSAYRGYREEFGSCLVLDPDLRTYLERLLEEKGAQQGYAVAMHLRDALANLWGDDAGAKVTRLVRGIKSRVEVTLRSEWDAVRTAMLHLPVEWRVPFEEFVARCETDLGASDDILSPFTLKGMAEALASWVRFREGDTRSPLTGTDLHRFSKHLTDNGVWASGRLASAMKVYMCYTKILAPGFQSEACQTVLRDLKGCATTAGPCRKTPSQIVPASLIYQTGQEMMDEALAGLSHNIHSAILYRNGLLLAIAAVIPLRRRALASLDFATSFQLEESPYINLDIAGKFLKLRQGRKNFERYQARVRSPVLWEATKVWVQKFRPIFDDGTALFPSGRVRDEALVSDVLGQVFGDTTEERLGVRVPIHRIRDCVATECIEEMEHGPGWARYLLDHRSERTIVRNYDHSKGVAVTREFGQLIASRRSGPLDLLI